MASPPLDLPERIAALEAEVQRLQTENAALQHQSRPEDRAAERLYERTRLLNQLSRAFAVAHSRRDVLQALLDMPPLHDVQTLNLFEAVDTAPGDPLTHVLLTESTNAHRNLPQNASADLREFPLTQHWAGQVQQPFIIDDTQTDEAVDEGSRAIFQAVEARAAVLLPLKQGDLWIGVLFVLWADVQHFDDDQRALFAALPALLTPVVGELEAIERLQQESERRARLLERQRLLNDLSRAFASSRNRAQMLRVLARVPYLRNHQTLNLFETVDAQPGERLGEIVYSEGTNPHPNFPLGTHADLRDFPLTDRWAGREQRPFVIEDAHQDNAVEEEARLVFDAINARAAVLLPLKQGDLWIGVIYILWSEPQTFDDEQRTFFEALPAQLTPFIASLQLLDTLEARVNARTRDLELAVEVGQRVGTTMQMSDLLNQVVELTREAFDLYFVTIFLYDADAEMLVRYAGIDEQGRRDLDVAHYIPLAQMPSVAAACARGRRIISVADTKVDHIHLGREVLPDTRSEIAIPILMNDELIGVFDLQSVQPSAFGVDELRVFTILAEQIGVAISNVRLFEEAEQARRAAQRADRVKSAFLASVSHELRTPLNAVINFAKFLADGDLGEVNEEQEYHLRRIVHNSTHLLALINDVLDMSKIEAGELQLFPVEDVDVGHIIENAMADTRPQLAEKPVEMHPIIADDLPTIYADPRRVFQILLNLLSNAAKFTEEGQIDVRADRYEEGLMVQVSDTGPGIAPEDREAVFEAFLQTESGLRHSEGTGLGMPISRRLARAHGGDLWFESSVGEGTTFYLYLPLYAADSDEIGEKGTF